MYVFPTVGDANSTITCGVLALDSFGMVSAFDVDKFRIVMSANIEVDFVVSVSDAASAFSAVFSAKMFVAGKFSMFFYYDNLPMGSEELLIVAGQFFFPIDFFFFFSLGLAYF